MLHGKQRTPFKELWAGPEAAVARGAGGAEHPKVLCWGVSTCVGGSTHGPGGAWDVGLEGMGSAAAPGQCRV